MELLFLDSMICSNEKTVVWKESCYDDWFPETSNWLGLLINMEHGGYIYGVNNIALIVIDQYEECTIVLVWNAEKVAVITLSYLIHFKIFSFDLLVEYFFKRI